jgi:subtilisin-like proprotein convertase family protein
MKKYITLLILIFSTINFISAQDRSCGMVAHMEKKMQDPVFAQEWHKNQAKFKAQVLKSANIELSNNALNPVVIPVAVHFPTGSESDRSCLEALAQTQVDILNGDYTATNPDANLWNSASQFYPGVVHGSANITFCIATQNHPANTDNDLVDGGPAVTIGYNFGNGNDFDNNWSGYMNFLVKNIGGILGYSPLGGSIAAGQSVVMSVGAFGSGAGCPNSGIVPGAPYNLGRTVTHELGHFYNLSHIWGDGGCAVDDGISDTPLASGANGGCPSPGSIPGCVAGEYEMSMNYMDYTNDACMYAFTQGQIDVVNNYINILQSQFKPNTVTCGSTDPYFEITAVTEDAVFSCPDIGEDAVFEFNFSTYNGFNTVVDFSATGQPDGSTVSFSPASANSDTTVTMSVSNIANTAQGNYNISVSATTSGFGNSVDTRTINFILSNNCTSIQCFNFSSEENLAIAIPDGIDANGTNDSYGERILVPLTLPEYASISSISVNVDVSHTYINDLLIAVFHPDLTTYSILWGRDCDEEDGLDVTFTDGAGTIVCANPTVGTFSPYQPLSIFNEMPTFVSADNVAENWTTNDWALYISDGYIDDTGVLNDWSIEICTEAALSSGEFNISANDIIVYPNPSSGVFNLEINSLNSSDVEILIYDLLGRVVFENNYENSFNFNETIDLSSENSGVFLINVTIGNNQITKRVIID